MKKINFIELEESMTSARSGYKYGFHQDGENLVYELNSYTPGFNICKIYGHPIAGVGEDLSSAYNSCIQNLKSGEFLSNSQYKTSKANYKYDGLDFENRVWKKNNLNPPEELSKEILKETLRHSFDKFEILTNDECYHVLILLNESTIKYKKIEDKISLLLAFNWHEVSYIQTVDNNMGTIHLVIKKTPSSDDQPNFKPIDLDYQITTEIPGYTLHSKYNSFRDVYTVYLKSIRDIQKTNYEDDFVPTELNLNIHNITTELKAIFDLGLMSKDYINLRFIIKKQSLNDIIFCFMNDIKDAKWRKFDFEFSSLNIKDKLLKNNFMQLELTAWKFDIIKN